MIGHQAQGDAFEGRVLSQEEGHGGQWHFEAASLAALPLFASAFAAGTGQLGTR
jgi:hypothetical protein